VMELKGLTENDNEGGDSNAPPPEASDGVLSLKLTMKMPLAALHADARQLMTFAAKLSFSVVEGEIEEKLSEFWSKFVTKFFACPRETAEPMQVEPAVGVKPLLIASPDASEDGATREARPPDTRWSMPLSFAKTTWQLFIGNQHFYIFVRLYHIVLERLAAAKEMATAAKESESSEPATANGDEKSAAGAAMPATAAQQNGIGGSTDTISRAALLEQLRRESNGDPYAAFTSALYQLIEGKMEASVYEDVLRTLLGTNAYILFTLHKIISQALKQLQLLLVEETSQKLLQLYAYEGSRTSAGSMSEATYRSNARLLLEGDDCFQMEQQYDENGGELLLAFLPEKEAEENEGEEDDDDEEDEEEEQEAESGDWSAYMDSFIQTTCGNTRPKGSSSSVMMRRGSRSTVKRWDKAVLLNGLECRAAVGGCKLRFVSRSEDVWYSNVKRSSAKRAAAAEASEASKKRRLATLLESRPKDTATNALAGLGPPSAAPLPCKHTFKPVDGAAP